MRASWEALHAGLDRSVRTLQADQAFQQAKQHAPALAGFDEPKKLVAHLTSKAGDLDEKDRILGTLVTLVQRREHHEVASALLWLGLWPGLDAVYRRRLRHFRDQPDELVAELAEAFTALVERLDLTAVHRVAATLVRSTERDVMDHRKRRWAEVNNGLEGEPNEPLRDLEGDIFSASWFDKASLQRWAASDHDLPSLSFDEDVAVLRAWLRAHRRRRRRAAARGAGPRRDPARGGRAPGAHARRGPQALPARARTAPRAPRDLPVPLRPREPRLPPTQPLNRPEEPTDMDHAQPITSPTDDDDFVRLPGLFRRWELEQVVEPGTDFHLEEAGNASDGTPLFAVYRRERTHDSTSSTSSSNPNPKKEQ